MYTPTARYGSPLSSVKRCWPAQPVGDGRHQLVGERLFAAADGDALAGAGQHREATALDGEVLHPFLRLRRLVEHRDELGGVAVGLGLGGGGALG